MMLLTSCNSQPTDNKDYSRERETMIIYQLRSRDIKDRDVLNAFRKVQRHLFVPEKLRNYAYEDYPLQIGYEQTISQSYIVAYMTEIIEPNKEMRVLEIGTGSGYQTAILAELCKEVYSIEIFDSLAVKANNLLTELGYKNIHIKIGNGYEGWLEYSPFDAIIVTCAPIDIPQKLIEQLADGGKMIIPTGEEDIQILYLVEKRKGKIKKTQKLDVRFVPMINN